MSPEVALGVRFARAVLARDARGRRVPRGDRAALGTARRCSRSRSRVMAAQLYPALKYALGHGKACTRVVVAGRDRSRRCVSGRGGMTGATGRADFEPHRTFLAGLAYRMLGSVAEAEDVVQDAFLRWREVDRDGDRGAPRLPRAGGVAALPRSHEVGAATRREQYVGTWLPEPVVARARQPTRRRSVGRAAARARAAVPARARGVPAPRRLRHGLRGCREAIDRTEAACRQLAARAREHVREDRPRFPANDTRGAHSSRTPSSRPLATGDVGGLAQPARGGRRPLLRRRWQAARGPEPDRRQGEDPPLLSGLWAKGAPTSGLRAEPTTINGLPGFVFRADEGTETLSVESAGGARRRDLPGAQPRQGPPPASQRQFGDDSLAGVPHEGDLEGAVRLDDAAPHGVAGLVAGGREAEQRAHADVEVAHRAVSSVRAQRLGVERASVEQQRLREQPRGDVALRAT